MKLIMVMEDTFRDPRMEVLLLQLLVSPFVPLPCRKQVFGFAFPPSGADNDVDCCNKVLLIHDRRVYVAARMFQSRMQSHEGESL